MGNLLQRFMKEEKGSGEAIGFLATILLLMLVVLNLYSPVKYALQKFIVESDHRMTLMEMEQEGGFTPNIEQNAIDRLKAFGFDEAKIRVSSLTPQPVQWGSPIELTIEYDNDYTQYSYFSYNLSNDTTLQTIRVTRSSVSREYFK